MLADTYLEIAKRYRKCLGAELLPWRKKTNMSWVSHSEGPSHRIQKDSVPSNGGGLSEVSGVSQRCCGSRIKVNSGPFLQVGGEDRR